MLELTSYKLVKSVDGDTTKIKQHEREIFVTDMAVGRGSIGCIGRGNRSSFHADSSGGCTSSPTGRYRHSGGSRSKRDAGLACAAETRKNNNG